MACYDKEIYYYTHAPDEDLDQDTFEDIPKDKFLTGLQAKRDKLAANPAPFLPQEPFALVHGDFCGRNMIIHNGKINAIIDWEFAGSYPLSELLGGTGIEMFELDDDNLLEHGQWSDKIRDLIVDKARARAWNDEKLELLVGEGNRELQLARLEMIPMLDVDDDGESAPGDDTNDAAIADENAINISSVAESLPVISVDTRMDEQ